MTQYTAHEVAGDPELYDGRVTFGKSKVEWECIGYSSSGYTVKFSRLIPVANMKVKEITVYVDPDRIVNWMPFD